VIRWIGTATDIHDQKMAERELERRVTERTAELARSKALLETVTSNAPVVLFATDAQGVFTLHPRRVSWANRVFRERFGESEGRRCYEYLFGRTEPCETCETYTVLKTHAPHQWERTGPDGRNYDIYDFPFTDSDGSTLILEMGIDITEAKRAKEAVQKASAYNRSLIDASLDPLVTIAPDGEITDVNHATEEATGRTRNELIGTDFSDYFTEPEKARAGYQQVFREGRVHDYELEVMHRDGHTTAVLYNASVYRGEAGQTVGVFAAARDITARKRAKAEVRRLNAELEERVRLRTAQLKASNKELEAFSYSVSHDLRAPLRAVDGFSSILLKEYGSQIPAEAQKYLHFVRRNAIHMGKLVDGLLALSRLGRQELKKQLVEVADVVRQAMSDLHTDCEGRTVEFTVGALPACEADSLLLRQVFANLLSNALKYSRKRERVRIEVGALKAAQLRQEAERDRPSRNLGQIQHPDAWVFYVRDDGVGFDMRYADKLFGVFQRLHRQEEFEGAGVGLATVQRIAHKHGGQVWAEGEVDKGATFYFTLGSATNETARSTSAEVD
jgi:PAS domain S-box-containing protein